MQPTIQRIIDKCLSGRFILTIVTAIIFSKCAWTGALDAKDVMAIIIMVFTLYFSKTDRKQNGEQK